jgi:hypothetical protein
MCDTCDEAKAFLTEITPKIYPTFVKLVSKMLPSNRFRDFCAFHYLIGSTPDPAVQVDLDVPDIRNFISNFRTEYLQEV